MNQWIAKIETTDYGIVYVASDEAVKKKADNGKRVIYLPDEIERLGQMPDDLRHLVIQARTIFKHGKIESYGTGE